MHRFFVPAEDVSHGQIGFSADQSRQMASVLRLRPGDQIVALDNAGWVYDVELTEVSPKTTRGVVRNRRLARNEPRTKLTLYPALLKSDKLEFVFQKCTELGASGFVPIIAARCNVGSIVPESRRLRWERIIVEAAEQSERERLPQLMPAMLFAQACEYVRGRGISFVAWERGERPSLRAVIASRADVRAGARPFSLNLFLGPEGGFTEEEINLAVSYGVVPVSLGPRILRAETAAIVGTTLVMAGTGDLD